MSNFYVDNNLVYKTTSSENGGTATHLIGLVNKTETSRIDDETVEDISYSFDLNTSAYVETGRTQRSDPLYTLDEVKAQQKQAIKASHDAELYTSFTSSALGTTKTYSYSQAAASRLEAWLTVVAANTTIASVDWYTVEDGKAMTHTRDQFVQVCMDGATRAQGIEMKLIQLFSNVDAIQTSSTVTLTQAAQQVKAITW